GGSGEKKPRKHYSSGTSIVCDNPDAHRVSVPVDGRSFGLKLPGWRAPPQSVPRKGQLRVQRLITKASPAYAGRAWSGRGGSGGDPWYCVFVQAIPFRSVHRAE